MRAQEDVPIERALRDLPGWSRSGDRVTRTFVHDDFHSAALFVARVATAAEAMGRAPDIAVNGGLVTLALGGGRAGVLSGHDVALARRIQRLGGEHRHPVGMAGP